MALNPRQAFKAGFLLRCAEEGVADTEMQDRLQLAEKRAEGGVLSTLTNWAMLLPLLATGAGATGGYYMGKALADARNETIPAKLPGENVPENIKRRQHAELLAAYKDYTELVNRRAKDIRRRQDDEKGRKPAYF
jgi:hypothetical protein